ncbi:ATP-binding cassette domain-containing protein, partial [Gammaproteobacteria bacterium]|nr:ATP-binding cassette domain-containing protein [Gammaproteobacteria bacterium]
MTENRLTLTTIDKNIAGKSILSDVSFCVGKNEIVGLLGPNGAGKTTAFYIAAGLLFPDRGWVEIDGHIVTNLPMHKRSLVGLSYLPQEASI